MYISGTHLSTLEAGAAVQLLVTGHTADTLIYLSIHIYRDG